MNEKIDTLWNEMSVFDGSSSTSRSSKGYTSSTLFLWRSHVVISSPVLLLETSLLALHYEISFSIAILHGLTVVSKYQSKCFRRNMP